MIKFDNSIQNTFYIEKQETNYISVGYTSKKIITDGTVTNDIINYSTLTMFPTTNTALTLQGNYRWYSTDNGTRKIKLTKSTGLTNEIVNVYMYYYSEVNNSKQIVCDDFGNQLYYNGGLAYVEDVFLSCDSISGLDSGKYVMLYTLDSNNKPINECFFNGTFDIEQRTTMQNVINPMSLSNSIEMIYYNINVSRISANFNGNTISLGLTTDDEIHKIILNGQILNPISYLIVTSSIIIDSNLPYLRNYNNNIIAIIYDNSGTKQDVVSEGITFKLKYKSYDNVIGNSSANILNMYGSTYLNSNNFFTLENTTDFSVSPNYNYYSYNLPKLNIDQKTLVKKNSTLSFTTDIGFDKQDEKTKHIKEQLQAYIGNSGFRIIRRNENAETFTVFTNCKLNTPPNYSNNIEKNYYSYNIEYQDRILLTPYEYGKLDVADYIENNVKIVILD